MKTPAEKVIDIDDKWFHGHTRMGKTFRQLFSEFQPFSIALVNLIRSRKRLLDARLRGFAIPGDAHPATPAPRFFDCCFFAMSS
jgi:hypothetical protein